MPVFFPFNSVKFLLWTNTEDYGMAKITISEALNIVPVKKTALYADIKKGVLSAEKDSRGRKVVDTAELERVYGSLKNPNTNGKQNGTPRTEPNGTGTVKGTARTEADTHGNANEGLWTQGSSRIIDRIIGTVGNSARKNSRKIKRKSVNGSRRHTKCFRLNRKRRVC